MAKKRIYVPVDDYQQATIKIIANDTDRSEAYIASKLIEDGIKFNLLTNYSMSPSNNCIENFKHNHK